MGKVKMETCNSKLLNYANYADVEVLNRLFKFYYRLKRLGEKGDTVAISIYTDLDYCLDNINPLYRNVIRDIYIYGYSYRQVAKRNNLEFKKIDVVLGNALKDCKKILKEE